MLFRSGLDARQLRGESRDSHFTMVPTDACASDTALVLEEGDRPLSTLGCFPYRTVLREYALEILNGVKSNKSRIDELIRSYIQGWDFDRIPSVDRNILRLAIYELLWATEVPEAVAIDEALNFARELSTEDSAKYVHGVLGKIAALKSQLI